ncbi:hypothetical protein BKA67DRAFT_649424 [Truncatella angustata]|uniref:Uncharacterized protein n=1 Tax=Truncatella angustata TaxID=152316 RepID=A0A9P8RKG4_9PEZI|nr:uncharacterized protein BKA67DRAFT_649424 [Truncatella angustata]KAH6647710.1 hypothetical protein BKA67DRAFT_649424 [Truncatella angustata]
MTRQLVTILVTAMAVIGTVATLATTATRNLRKLSAGLSADDIAVVEFHGFVPGRVTQLTTEPGVLESLGSNQPFRLGSAGAAGVCGLAVTVPEPLRNGKNATIGSWDVIPIIQIAVEVFADAKTKKLRKRNASTGTCEKDRVRKGNGTLMQAIRNSLRTAQHIHLTQIHRFIQNHLNGQKNTVRDLLQEHLSALDQLFFFGNLTRHKHDGGNRRLFQRKNTCRSFVMLDLKSIDEYNSYAFYEGSQRTICIFAQGRKAGREDDLLWLLVHQMKVGLCEQAEASIITKSGVGSQLSDSVTPGTPLETAAGLSMLPPSGADAPRNTSDPKSYWARVRVNILNYYMERAGF